MSSVVKADLTVGNREWAEEGHDAVSLFGAKRTACAQAVSKSALSYLVALKHGESGHAIPGLFLIMKTAAACGPARGMDRC